MSLSKKKKNIEESIDFEVLLDENSMDKYCCLNCKKHIERGVHEYGINFFQPTSVQELCAYRLALACVKSVFINHVRLNGTAGTGKTLTAMLALKELLKIPINKAYLYQQNNVNKTIYDGYDWDVVVFVRMEALVYQWAINFQRFNLLFEKNKKYAIYTFENGQKKPFNCNAEINEGYKILIIYNYYSIWMSANYSTRITVWDDCEMRYGFNYFISTYIVQLDVVKSRRQSLDVHLPCSMAIPVPVYYNCYFEINNQLANLFKHIKDEKEITAFLNKYFLNVSAKTQKDYLTNCYNNDMEMVMNSNKKENEKRKSLQILKHNYDTAIDSVEKCMICLNIEDCNELKSTKCCKKSLCSVCFLTISKEKMKCPNCRSFEWALEKRKTQLDVLFWLLEKYCLQNSKIIIGFIAEKQDEMNEISCRIINKNYKVFFDSRPFNECKESCLLLCTRNMVGVNIVECDYVILYGDGFTNVELAQIVGRAVRPCNKRKVTIISLKPTNEEGMKEVLAPFSIKLIYKPQQAVKKALIETQKQVLELFVEPFLNEKLLLTDYIVNENSCLRDFIKNRKKYNHSSEMILKSDDVDFLKNFKCINALQVSTSTQLNETDENYISNNGEKNEYIINKCCVIDFKNNDFEFQFLNYSDLVVYKTLTKTIIVEKGFSELYGINCLASQEDVPFFVYAKYEHLFRLKNFKSKRFSDPKYKWKIIIIVSNNEEHEGLIRNEGWTTYAQYVFFTKRLEIP